MSPSPVTEATAHSTSTSAADALEERIRDRTATIGIIGLGYVGLPLARAFGEAGFRVQGFDIDAHRCHDLNDGRSPLQHLPGEFFSRLTEQGRFTASSDFRKLRRVDVAIICVPTPLDSAREPDLSAVRAAATELRHYLNPGTLVILESTTYPGTTEEILVPALEEGGLFCGEDIFVAFSPEREDPGNLEFETRTIPKLVGGVDEISGILASLLYGEVIEAVIDVGDSKVAEAAKVLENIYRAVNIALVNELKILFDRMGIDVWKVIEAASTKPFGFQAFYPGPGLGGHCIPIDPFYLAWRARQYELPTRFIELAGEINTAMPEFVMQKLQTALNDRCKPVRKSQILIVGVAYKRDVEDLRESPALKLISLIREAGGIIAYHDPHVPTLRTEGTTLTSAPLDSTTLESADAVLVVTDHKSVDYEMIAEHAPLVIDTRNVMSNTAISPENWVRA